MSAFVIGVSSKLDETSAVALNLNGEVMGRVVGKTCSHVTLSRSMAQTRAINIIDRLLLTLEHKREDCKCLLVSAAGIDSPKTKELVTECFAAAHMLCPVICLNDGTIALYTTTRGLGIAAVSGKGSIVVGRNAAGEIARCGGYPISIHGDEGSAQWIALEALHLASRWLDGDKPKTALSTALDDYFCGLDIEKMTECARSLRRRPVDTALARLVIECAGNGDATSAAILRKGAGELFEVAQSCADRLHFMQEAPLRCGVWGDVFQHSECYQKEFERLFLAHYPNGRIIPPAVDEATGSAQLALAYLNGELSYITKFQF